MLVIVCDNLWLCLVSTADSCVLLYSAVLHSSLCVFVCMMLWLLRMSVTISLCYYYSAASQH